MATKKATPVKKVVGPPLPSGILATDLTYPKYGDKDQMYYEPGNYDDAQFELWYTERFGWCIPTLFISRTRAVGRQDRTYATTLDGKPVRIGKGPHVKAAHTVYVRVSRKAALQKFLDIRREGAEISHSIRDRISSRRAQGQIERAQGHRSWTWDS